MSKKYLVWHIEGGLGKNIVATSLIKDIKEYYKDRSIILVCTYPDVFLNNPFIDKVYKTGNHPYFYENYILNKDTLVFRHEPYYQTGHILKSKHLIESWCELLNIKYNNQLPTLYLNYSQNKLNYKWTRNKPILLLQTTGGSPVIPSPNFPNTEIPTSEYEWCRDLPIELAQIIVERYSAKYHIIQLSKINGYYLEGVERIDKHISNSDLVSLISMSKHRILIDSAPQHIAATLKLPSVVFWIGTSPIVFGYKSHKNIVAKSPQLSNQLINSYLFDYNFGANDQECPYSTIDNMFDMSKIIKELDIIL